MGELDPETQEEEIQMSPKPASKTQIALVKKLMNELGLELSQTASNRLRRKNFAEVSRIIDRLQVRLDTAGPLSARKQMDEMASNKALRYLFRLRDKAQNPIRGEERLQIMAASSPDIQKATQQAMADLQAYNDEHGVPIPLWRFKRGLYREEVMKRNGVAGIVDIPEESAKLTLEEIRVRMSGVLHA